jgi:hypothetical protein
MEKVLTLPTGNFGKARKHQIDLLGLASPTCVTFGCVLSRTLWTIARQGMVEAYIYGTGSFLVSNGFETLWCLSWTSYPWVIWIRILSSYIVYGSGTCMLSYIVFRTEFLLVYRSWTCMLSYTVTGLGSCMLGLTQFWKQFFLFNLWTHSTYVDSF